MFFSRPAGVKFTDRGELNAYDFTQGDFTKDNGWHELDLSAIVGSQKCLVLMHIIIQSTDLSAVIAFCSNAYTQYLNSATCGVEIINQFLYYDVLVYTDSSGKIQYKSSVAPYANLDVVVGGWFK